MTGKQRSQRAENQTAQKKNDSNNRMSAPTRCNIKFKSKQLQPEKKDAKASMQSPEQKKRRQQRKDTEQQTPRLIKGKV